MIVALLALFVALGGAGAAASVDHFGAGKSHMAPAHFYVAHGHLAPGHSQLLLALPGIGKLTAWCFPPLDVGAATSGYAKTRFQSSVNRLNLYIENSIGSHFPAFDLDRGQAVSDIGSGNVGSEDWYHSTYSASTNSGPAFVLGTIDVFATGGLPKGPAGRKTCRFQVSAILQPS